MAREGITYTQVAAAADLLVAQDKTPSIKAVREALGTGSPNTIHKHLTNWRAARPSTAAAAYELPAEIVNAFGKELGKAAAQARAEIEGTLVQAQAEAVELAASGEVLEAERDALAEHVVMLTKERDSAVAVATAQAGEIARQAAEIERERKLAGEAQTETATARLKVEAQAEKLDERGAEIERLRTALDASQAARQAAEQAAAVSAARLEAAAARAAEIDARATKAEQQAQATATKAEQQARELASANMAVQAGQARLESAAREMEDLRKQAREARAESKAASELSAELKGKLSALKGPNK